MIWGYSIIVYTDSKNLTFIESPSNQRIAYWKLLLSEFNLTFKHIDVCKNTAANFMSRFVTSKKLYNTFYTLTEYSGSLISIDDVISWQLPISKNSFKIKRLKIKKFNGDDITITKDSKIFIPQERIKDFITKIHNIIIHPGSTRLYNTIKRYYYGDLLKRKIEEFTNNCIKCQVSKNYRRKKSRNFHLNQKEFNDIVATDLVEPYKLDEFTEGEGKVYVLTLIDMHIRLVSLHVIEKITSENISLAIEN
ncbi:hypothetical protein HERIO_979 [Hepatospora eriocheir]|uniref:Integrase zinc-binding domain-containing protein n=1 Tax=Hepatospora eriocheir TaxID=1081669 RepID=A0A1X0QBG9_9MICR|nr:hypothetical protein HERIO_979 [Hepatospora eriocheir]